MLSLLSSVFFFFVQLIAMSFVISFFFFLDQLIHVIIVIGSVFCFQNHRSYNSLLKLSYSYYLLFIFTLLVRADSVDPGILIYCHKDSFIGWIMSRKISKLGKNLKLQVISYARHWFLSNQSIWQQFWQLKDRLFYF